MPRKKPPHTREGRSKHDPYQLPVAMIANLVPILASQADVCPLCLAKGVVAVLNSIIAKTDHAEVNEGDSIGPVHGNA
jgi:hypothetical protein